MFDPATIKAMLGGSGGAAVPIIIMFAMFTPEDDFMMHVAEASRGFIIDQVERATIEEPGPYKDSLCRSLTEAIAQLCATAPDDALCMDRAILMEKAGC